MCYSKWRQRRRKAKLAIPEFSTIFLTAPEPKANVCFGRLKPSGWGELGLFWFTSATGLTQGLWHCPARAGSDRLGGWRAALIPLHCAAECSGMESEAGGSTHWHKSRQCAIRLFITRLSASQKAIGSLFFFSKNLPLCIAHIQLTIRCYADQCPKYQSSQMFARALGKPYGLRTICILSWMCFNFYLLASAIVFTVF